MSLPSEIWIEIFAFVIFSPRPSDSSANRRRILSNNIFRLLAVCHSWNALITGTSFLWTPNSLKRLLSRIAWSEFTERSSRFHAMRSLSIDPRDWGEHIYAMRQLHGVLSRLPALESLEVKGYLRDYTTKTDSQPVILENLHHLVLQGGRRLPITILDQLRAPNFMLDISASSGDTISTTLTISPDTVTMQRSDKALPSLLLSPYCAFSPGQSLGRSITARFITHLHISTATVMDTDKVKDQMHLLLEDSTALEVIRLEAKCHVLVGMLLALEDFSIAARRGGVEEDWCPKNVLWISDQAQALYQDSHPGLDIRNVDFQYAQYPSTSQHDGFGQSQLGMASAHASMHAPRMGLANMNPAYPGGPQGWHPDLERLLLHSSARTTPNHGTRFHPYSVRPSLNSFPWASTYPRSLGVHRTPHVNSPAAYNPATRQPNVMFADPRNLAAWSHDFIPNSQDFEVDSSGGTDSESESECSDDGDDALIDAVALPCPKGYKPRLLPSAYREAAQAVAGPKVHIPSDLSCYEALISNETISTIISTETIFKTLDPADVDGKKSPAPTCFINILRRSMLL
ncbi:hypothetical protein BDZ89DRAFT_1164927 [Hymenopellis radicata]|nr:hypothetical protein BDZ89DRAFT_1164927 [Hymenopellis radicata]